jgi:hypothetical protein
MRSDGGFSKNNINFARTKTTAYEKDYTFCAIDTHHPNRKR